MAGRNIKFNRDDIVDAALHLVRKNGWAGFSAQAVGKVIEASTMPIYSHFANVRELEDAVCLKAFELLKERLLVERTGDKWLDQALRYLEFAIEEKYLFRSLWDGRNIELSKSMGKDLERYLARTLVDYPPFIELGVTQRDMLRCSRALIVQRLAISLNNDNSYFEEKEFDAKEFILMTSKALYDGFRLQSKELSL